MSQASDTAKRAISTNKAGASITKKAGASIPTEAKAPAIVAKQEAPYRPGQEVTFFAYSEHNGEEDEIRLLESPVIVLKGRTYEDHKGRLQYADVGALVAHFFSGMYQTKNPEAIKALDNWNRNHDNSEIVISRKVPNSKKGVKTETIIETQNVLPSSVAIMLDVAQLKAVLKSDFGFTTQFDSHDEIVAEAREAGIIK